MSHATIAALDRAAHTAQDWIVDVADEFETDDVEFAYRVTRAWLHVVRDRLPVAEAAHFAAQLPELLRGTFYEGWQPSAVPQRFGRIEFVERFANTAGIAKSDVPKAVHAVSATLDWHISGHLRSVLQLLPEELRELLRPVQR
ncbi:MAG TPA: DUF2267 domain-containing protein [Jatrophihabitans sp.]|jgi:uncharacterized protein (DUF2267 family)|nr:DUF2267 domain-containing protein [Jatrophihabitans sp.]